MDDTTIKFRCCTYNIHGFNSTKLSYIRHLLDLFNIVMIQEHWLNDKQLESFANLFPGYSVNSKSAMDSSQILRGRPYGGVAIIFPDSFGSSATFIDSKSDRLCALGLHIIHSIQLYLFGIYMPCDLNDHLSIGKYESVLSEISSLCIKYNAEYVCIGGDFNTQFSRRESLNTKTILQFIGEENLYVPLNHSYANVDYSYSNVSTNTYSIIDHVIVSSNLSDVISSYYIICNDVENQSDHSPIVLELLIDISKHITVPYNSKPCKNLKCANQKDIDMYKTKLDNILHYIDMPYELLQCNNVLCEIKGHVNGICKLHDDIISACLYASEIIPETGKKSNKIPGWDVKLSHEREIALFWRSIWISMKSPRDGVVAEIMRRTHAQYHYAIRN